MALWPFRRKGSRRRPANIGPPAPPRAMSEPVATDAAAGNGSGSGASMEGASRRTSRRRPPRNDSSPTKSQWRGRTYSFSPGRRDTLRIARRKQAEQDSVPPVPTLPPAIAADGPQTHNLRGHGSPAHHADDHARNMELGESVDRVPTLHHNNSGNKRRAQPLPQRKSSKRRKEDHDREVEVKRLSESHPAPTRPAPESWTAGRPIKKDSKRLRTGFNKHWDPDSEISLPVPESLNSAMSSDSDQIGWKLTALDALAPRPTLRYSSNPLSVSSATSGPHRAGSQKRKLAEREPIAQATLKAHKRVDDLADDLDASDLRELMERDKRRKARKEDRERERAERRLARRSQRQRDDQEASEKNGTPPPQNLDRGVLGRDTTGLTTDTTSAVVTSSRRRSSDDSPRQREKRPARLELEEPRDSSPLDQFHRVNSVPLTPAQDTPAEESDRRDHRKSLDRRRSRSPSPRLISFIKPRKRVAKSPAPTDDDKTDARSEKLSVQPSTRIASRSEESDSGTRISDSGSSRPWASIFRWGRSGWNKRDSGPSSFSNTSRDSMMASQPPQVANYGGVQRSNSKVPKRTMSRFREDLPELPVSPPDSRMTSPEGEVVSAEPLPSIADEADDTAVRYGTPTSGHRATPISIHRDRDQIAVSPVPQSMSLASVDSEASWLSGRMGGRKRTSSGMQGSFANYSIRPTSAELDEHDGDHQSIAEDEFLKTVVDDRLHSKSTGEALPSSDEDEESSPKWGTVKQNPLIMHHRDTMRSTEGLLSSFSPDDKHMSFGQDSLEGISEGETPGIPQRATSMDFSQKHARPFSAGSAKLLEVMPRASEERRRSKLEPATQ